MPKGVRLWECMYADCILLSVRWQCIENSLSLDSNDLTSIGWFFLFIHILGPLFRYVMFPERNNYTSPNDHSSNALCTAKSTHPTRTESVHFPQDITQQYVMLNTFTRFSSIFFWHQQRLGGMESLVFAIKHSSYSLFLFFSRVENPER